MGKIVYPKLTQEQKDNITLFVLKGHTLNEIAKMYGVRYAVVVRYFKWEKEVNNTISIEKMQGKSLPYYEDEDDYGRIPTYKVYELSDEELKIYNDLKDGEIKIKRIRR